MKPPNRQTRSPIRCFASARSTSPEERFEVSVSIASGPVSAMSSRIKVARPQLWKLTR